MDMECAKILGCNSRDLASYGGCAFAHLRATCYSLILFGLSVHRKVTVYMCEYYIPTMITCQEIFLQ